ncbi:hypothetical protein FB382_004365 [Nocardioides ginsengisegetis]|uniref:Uncharacterized protein n=1 Tax=Nocardioides ginsengisegetis TaxID=661491 RepID=A0A7W3J4F3_9ACTN|nr:hypothetical protein [Nocardioides ginsengisegetis]MBA8805590.1 hypothetical protein [Nocardioides ginsengisegetis]MBA8806014.1 hypothetical protein [Nocardioides ginsengisegetis]
MTIAANLATLAADLNGWTNAIDKARRAYAQHLNELEAHTICRDCDRPATSQGRCDPHRRRYWSECSQRARDKKKETTA